MAFNQTSAHWQYLLHEIIFEADTRVGKYFDFFLIPK